MTDATVTLHNTFTAQPGDHLLTGKSIVDLITKLLRSKTVVFNVLMLTAGLMTYLLNSDIIAQYPDVTAGLVSAAAAINVVLRFVTATSLFGKIDEIKVPKQDTPVKSVK